MKNEIKNLAIVSVIIFCLAGNAFAEDRKSVTVSCIIPAIIGLNAVIASDEKAIQKDKLQAADQQSEAKDKLVPNVSASEKTNMKNIFFLSEEKTDTGLLQTVYSR